MLPHWFIWSFPNEFHVNMTANCDLKKEFCLDLCIVIKDYYCFVYLSNGNGSKMNGSLEHLDQPDPDSIKMFVGQIPRSWSETELKELFEPFGAVHQINILRDRTQNPPQSKGKVMA